MDKNKIEFEQKRKFLIKSLENLMDEYNEFAQNVSPKNWRTTGNHFTHFKKIRTEIFGLEMIKESEKTEDYYEYLGR